MSVPAPGNPLVAERVDSTTAITGIGVVESAMGLYEGVESGSWVEGGLGAAGAGLETLGLVLDPVGTLVSYGVAWLMEHVQPLSDALDWLAGDPDTIASYAVTWRNVAAAVQQAGADFGAAVGEGTAGWQGQAADGYRAQTARQVEQLTAAGTGAQTVGSIIEGAGVLVGVVREVVRDLVAECVSTLIARIPQWLAEIGLTVGIATPHVVASAVALIARWVDRIAEVIIKLTRSLGNLMPLIRRLDELFAGIRDGLSGAGRAAPSSPGGPAAPTGPAASPNSPDPSADAAPSTPSAGSPSSTTPTSAASTADGAGAAPSSTTSQSTTPAEPTSKSPTVAPSSGPSSIADPPSASTSRIRSALDGESPPASTEGREPFAGGPRDSRIEHYRLDGGTIPTDELTHPNADLLDDSKLREAEANPIRLEEALRPGVPPDHPAVSGVVPNNFDPHGGLGETGWNREYWPSGIHDEYGNRKLAWPDPQTQPEGFISPEARRPTVLESGMVIDRFGPGFGRFASPPDTPYPDRGLPPENIEAGYHQYRVMRPIPVWEGDLAPAMGQPGGGVQYYLPEAVIDLVNAGYLEEVDL